VAPVLWTKGLIAVAAVVLFYWGFYRLLARRRIYDVLRGPLRRLRLTRRFSLDEISQVFHLLVTGASQLLFFLLLSFLLGVDLRRLLFRPFPPILLLYGALLGVVLAGISSFLSQVAMKAAEALFPARVPASGDEWLSLVRGGWMRLYIKTTRHASLPLAVASILLYIGVEELVFRGVLVTALLPLGKTAAVLVAGALFVAVQAFHMPSFTSAMFPMIGAAMVALCHGFLFVQTGHVIPLIVAHAVFFLALIL
jgi:hypothetical protein